MKTVTEIRSEIESVGLKSFSAKIRKNRPVGCPTKRMLKEELQELSNEEIHVAFYLGLIGNASRTGTVIGNPKYN